MRKAFPLWVVMSDDGAEVYHTTGTKKRAVARMCTGEKVVKYVAFDAVGEVLLRETLRYMRRENNADAFTKAVLRFCKGKL